MQKLRVFSRSKDKDLPLTLEKPGSLESTPAPRSPSSQTPTVTTAESNGKLSPELTPIVTLLSAQSHRKYQEGIFMLLKDITSEGEPAERKWLEVYGIMIGNELAFWDSEQLESQDSEVENKPSYLNFSDGSFKACLNLPSSNGEINNVIVLSTTLKNRFLLQFSLTEEFNRWHAAFRLATFEYKSLQEAYTGSLLSARGSLLSDIRVVLSEKRYDYEDWTSVRFGSGMPWKRCYAVIEPSKKKRKGTVQGKIHFYENEKKLKKTIMATITSADSVYAVYPRNYTVVDKSTMIKLDGSIQFDKKDEPKDCSIFLMPEQHSAVPGYDTLIRFIVPLMDAFTLYGRPTKLNADKSDPSSLLFGLPVLPNVHYLEIQDIMKIAASTTSLDWSQDEWDTAIKNILRSKLETGYVGCGSVDGVNGAVNMLNASKDLAAGKIRYFINKPEANEYLVNSPRLKQMDRFSPVGSSEEHTLKTATSDFDNSRNDMGTFPSSNKGSQSGSKERLRTESNSLYSDNDKTGISPVKDQFNQKNSSPLRSNMTAMHLSPEQSTTIEESPSPQVVNIYKKYAQIPEYNNKGSLALNNKLGKLNLLDPDVNDIHASNRMTDQDDDDGLVFRSQEQVKDRILSPFTDFNNAYRKSTHANMLFSKSKENLLDTPIAYKNNSQNSNLDIPKQRSPKKQDFSTIPKADNEEDFYPIDIVSDDDYANGDDLDDGNSSEPPVPPAHNSNFPSSSKPLNQPQINGVRSFSQPMDSNYISQLSTPPSSQQSRCVPSNDIVPQKVSYNPKELFEAPAMNPYLKKGQTSPHTPTSQQNLPPPVQPPNRNPQQQYLNRRPPPPNQQIYNGSPTPPTGLHRPPQQFQPPQNANNLRQSPANHNLAPPHQYQQQQQPQPSHQLHQSQQRGWNEVSAQPHTYSSHKMYPPGPGGHAQQQYPLMNRQQQQPQQHSHGYNNQYASQQPYQGANGFPPRHQRQQQPHSLQYPQHQHHQQPPPPPQGAKSFKHDPYAIAKSPSTGQPPASFR